MHFNLRALQAFAFLASSLPISGAVPRHQHNPILPKRQALDTNYDYVVVGSGPGGGPTAANLAAAGYKVLLIEAGGDSATALVESVPILWPKASEFQDIEWDFWVTRSSDPAVQAQDAQTSYRLSDGSVYTGLDPPANATMLGSLYPRTGTLGGCSRHNAMVTIRAFDSDWEAIATATGDSSWSGSTFQTLFENIEHCDYLPNSVVGHGFSGWFWTELTSLVSAVGDLKLISIIIGVTSALGKSIVGILVDTVAGLGQVLLLDLNAPGRTIPTGPYQVPLSMKNSVRGGAYDRIMQIANATNSDGSRKYHLDIKLNTLVTKIQFDQSGSVPRATGVEYMEGQSVYRADPRWNSGSVTGSGVANASREVIIAGGAFNTPQILKLSGVGPKAELESFDIPVVVDLPGVGANLRDHIEVSVISTASSNFSIIDGCTFLEGYPEVPDPCLEKYQSGDIQATKGPYGTSGVALGVVIKSSAATQNDPDVWIYGGPINFPGFFPKWADRALGDHYHWTWITLKASTQNTAGAVTLLSNDPRDLPAVAFNTFDDPESAAQDLQAAYEGIEFSRRSMDNVIPIGGTLSEMTPGRSTSSEDAVKDYIRTQSFGHHACCTAKIGGDDDPNAVLDSNFKVRGTTGLRVVDASSFPIIPGFFVALPIYLIAEKASASILADA